MKCVWLKFTNQTSHYHSDSFKMSLIMFCVLPSAVYFDLGQLPDTQGYLGGAIYLNHVHSTQHWLRTPSWPSGVYNGVHCTLYMYTTHCHSCSFKVSFKCSTWTWWTIPCSSLHCLPWLWTPFWHLTLRGSGVHRAYIWAMYTKKDLRR